MPLYTFECPKCGKEFDYSVSLSEFNTKVVKCPHDGEISKRKITPLKTTSTTWRYWRTE